MYVFVEKTNSLVVPPQRPCGHGRVAAVLGVFAVLVVVVGIVQSQLAVGSVNQPAIPVSNPLADVLSHPGVCLFKVDDATEIVVSPNSFCDDGATDTIKGTSSSKWVGPFPVITEDQIDATAISCSLTRPTDGKHLWVATHGAARATSVCAGLRGIGWQ